MNAELNRDFAAPSEVLRNLVAEHGRVRVVLALAGLLARRSRPRRQLLEGDIPDRMRRDIGLEPLPRMRNYWDL